MAERSLVTGAAGFVGLRLSERLATAGDDVVMVDNFSRGCRDHDFSRVAAACRVVEADLTDPSSLASLGEFDHLYHLAGRVGTDLVARKPAKVLYENALATLNVMRLAIESRADRTYLASTSEVYAAAVERGLASIPTAEDVPFVVEPEYRPRSAYATSKHLGEQMGNAMRFEHGLAVVACRFHNLYGPRMGHAHVIPQFIDRILDRVDPFAIHGDQTRSYCYIDDAIDILVALRDVPEPPAVLNVGNCTEEVSTVDLARRLFCLAGWSAPIEVHPAPDGSPARRCPDVSLATRLTGLRPAWSLDEGLRTTFSWYSRAREEHSCGR